MIFEEKKTLRFPLLCGFFHFIVHPSGPRLAAPRWVKASYRWSGYDFRLGGEEIRFKMGVKTAHKTRIHVSLSLNTIESLFDLVKCGFWSAEATPGVRRPVTIRVRTAYGIAAT